jgi:soluble lytic murein transglycosylase-like protein
MARVLNTGGIPTILPDIRPPSDYQDINASPQSFGAQIGAATERAGIQTEQSANQTADTAISRQNYYNQIASDDAFNKLQKGYLDTTYGDPNDPTKPGFYSLRGQKAMDAYQPTIKSMSDLRDQISGDLPNDHVRLEFDIASRRLEMFTREAMGRHYDQQLNVYGVATNQASINNAAQASALDWNNPTTLNNSLFEAERGAFRKAQSAGADPDSPIYNQEMLQATSKVLKDTALARANSDPSGALGMINQYRDKMTAEDYAALQFHLKGKADDASAASAVQRYQNAPSQGVPSAPLPPSEYQPIISSSAQQYGVPPELLTRMLSAENDFNPTGVSSAGARGIAQFMPETAAKYGVNPDDPKSAIPGAAHYLADLHAQTGSWHAALKGYLGGEPANDVSYTRKGVWQYADQIDHGSSAAQAATIASNTTTSSGASRPIEVWGDSLGVGLLNHMTNAGGSAHGGDSPTTILNNIKAVPPTWWGGKDIVLSSGTNSGANGPELPVVEQTIKYLKDNGANVAVIGYGSNYKDRDQQLQQIALSNGVQYVPAGANDGTHMSPAGYQQAATQARNALAAAQNPDTVTPTANAPVQATLASAQGSPAAPIAGQLTPGNIDLTKRPIVRNPDGSISTVRSMSFEEDGKQVLIPTVAADGSRILSDKEAIDQYHQTGQHLGIFDTPEHATAYAQQLHQQQADFYLKGGTSAPLPAPGLDGLSAAQSELAQNHAKTVVGLTGDTTLNPEAKEKALRLEDLDFRSRDSALTAQKQAIVDKQNATADDYSKKILGGDPAQYPAIMHDIANDDNLNRALRENLVTLIQAHQKSTADGDVQKYGSKFYDYFQRIHAAPDDPNRIRDPSQLFPLAVPKDDGSQDLTLAGVDKLTSELKANSKPDTTAESAIRQGALAYAKQQLSFELEVGNVKIPDPKGMAAFNIGFTPAFYKYWDAGVAAGKSPQELVKKDALDGLIAPFMRSDADRARDYINTDVQGQTALASPTTPVTPSGPSPAAIDYLRRNPDLKSDFDRKFGVGASDKVLVPAAPEAPMAR